MNQSLIAFAEDDFKTTKIIKMKVNLSLLAGSIVALIATSCQPDYGHLQPEYEQLLEVQEQVQTATNEVRSNQKKAAQIEAEIKQIDRLLDSLENQ